jgi:hypothetical protein
LMLVLMLVLVPVPVLVLGASAGAGACVVYCVVLCRVVLCVPVVGALLCFRCMWVEASRCVLVCY